MIENYYSILNLHPSDGFYKIARHYKRLAKKSLFFLKNSEDEKKSFIQINKAFEILRNEQLRKYYDILYAIFILEKKSRISDLTIQKYMWIVTNYSIIGDNKAEKLINNDDYLTKSGIRQSLILSFILNWDKMFTNFPGRLGLILSPIFVFGYIIIGIVFLLKQFWGMDINFLAPGLILLILGCIILYSHFRRFTIDLMNEKYSFPL